MQHFYLTTKSTIQCVHGGKVDLSSCGEGVPNEIDGAPVLLKSKLMEAAITACPSSPPSGKPCMKVMEIPPDCLAQKFTIEGDPVVLSTIFGKLQTDGSPPGPVSGDPAQQIAGEDEVPAAPPVKKPKTKKQEKEEAKKKEKKKKKSKDTDHLVLLNDFEDQLANHAYVLKVAGKEIKGILDDSGKIEIKLPKDAKKIELEIDPFPLEVMEIFEEEEKPEALKLEFEIEKPPEEGEESEEEPDDPCLWIFSSFFLFS